MTGGMTECAAKMQKAPTFSGRGWTASGGFCVVLIYLPTHGPIDQCYSGVDTIKQHEICTGHERYNQ